MKPYEDNLEMQSDELRAINAKLLEALEKIANIIGGPQANPNEFVGLVKVLETAEQAIKKAKEA